MRRKASPEAVAAAKKAREAVSKKRSKAAASVENFTKRGARGAAKKSPKTNKDGTPRKGSIGSPSYVKRIVGEVDAMIQDSNNFSEARPKHLVGLYVWGHSQIYGIECSELRGQVWVQATKLAGTRLKKDFDGNPEKFVEFIRWAWSREAWLEEKRRDSGSSKRLNWKEIFQWRSKLDDYRMSEARERARNGETFE